MDERALIVVPFCHFSTGHRIAQEGVRGLGAKKSLEVVDIRVIDGQVIYLRRIHRGGGHLRAQDGCPNFSFLLACHFPIYVFRVKGVVPAVLVQQ